MTRINTVVILSLSTLLAASVATSGCELFGGDESTGGSSGDQGSSSSSSSSSSAGNCHGDQTAWTVATAPPLACEKNSDCCVIVSGCTSEAQVVTSSKFSSAKAAWPYCDDDCTFCIAPAVKVECVNKECVGYHIPDDQSPASDLRKDHCGKDEPPVMLPEPDVHFVCGG